MGDPWGIRSFRVRGKKNCEKKKIIKKIQKSTKFKFSWKFSFDLKWSKSHWEGNKTPSKLKNHSINSQISAKVGKKYEVIFWTTNFSQFSSDSL